MRLRCQTRMSISLPTVIGAGGRSSTQRNARGADFVSVLTVTFGRQCALLSAVGQRRGGSMSIRRKRIVGIAALASAALGTVWVLAGPGEAATSYPADKA